MFTSSLLFFFFLFFLLLLILGEHTGLVEWCVRCECEISSISTNVKCQQLWFQLDVEFETWSFTDCFKVENQEVFSAEVKMTSHRTEKRSGPVKTSPALYRATIFCFSNVASQRAIKALWRYGPNELHVHTQGFCSHVEFEDVFSRPGNVSHNYDIPKVWKRRGNFNNCTDVVSSKQSWAFNSVIYTTCK